MGISNKTKESVIESIIYVLIFAFTFFVGFFTHSFMSEAASDTYICNSYQDVDSAGGRITGYTNRLRCYVIGYGGYKDDEFCTKSESTTNGVNFINSVCSGYGKFTFNINNKGPSQK